MKKYATEQRKILLSFLREHYDRQYSVEEIAERLYGIENISISSIYRNINSMVAEGAVRRFSADGSRKFLYQYIDGNDCHKHLHLKCESCGQIFHMDEKSMENILTAVMNSSNFNVDVSRTILYGLCEDCD